MNIFLKLSFLIITIFTLPQCKIKRVKEDKFYTVDHLQAKNKIRSEVCADKGGVWKANRELCFKNRVRISLQLSDECGKCSDDQVCQNNECINFCEPGEELKKDQDSGEEWCQRK